MFFLFCFFDMFFFLFFFVYLCWDFCFCWGGGFYFMEGFSNYFLFFISVFIFYLIFFSETNYVIVLLSLLLCLVSFFFFFVFNFLFFYIFFEISLLPILFMVLGFGLQIEKINSSYFLIFYSMFSSFPFLFIFFFFDFDFSLVYFDSFISFDFFFWFSLGFLMKFPIYFLHFWLPKVHVEAPTSASMLLAGLLLKFGTFGFYRFLGSFFFINHFFYLLVSFVGLILCSFLCLFQSDVKSLVAYSSVVHMSFILFVVLFFSTFSKNSGLFMMISHGFVSTVIFYMVGEMFHILYSRLIYFFSGVFASNFVFVVFFSLFLLFNAGFPFGLSFLSEFFGLLVVFNFSFFFFFLLLCLFFFSFYYCVFFLVNLFLGCSSLYFGYSFFLFLWPYMIMLFNLFFFFMI